MGTTRGDIRRHALMPRAAGFAVAVCLAMGSTAQAQGLRLVGRSDLGGGGLNGDLTVVGTTAIVAAGMMPAAGVHAHFYNPYPCPAVAVKLVDLFEPRAPKVVGTIPVPAGLAAHGVSAARVRTPAFTGDLLAVALTMCGAAGSGLERGVTYYDITTPSTPTLLGRDQADADLPREEGTPACGPPPLGDARCASSQHSVSLVQREDGRLLSLSIEPGAAAGKYPSGDLRVVDVTDPRHPVQVGAFPRAGTPIFSNNGCRPFSAGHGAGFSHEGQRGLLAFYDGGLFILDLEGTGAPVQRGHVLLPGRPCLRRERRLRRLRAGQRPGPRADFRGRRHRPHDHARRRGGGGRRRREVRLRGRVHPVRSGGQSTAVPAAARPG